MPSFLKQVLKFCVSLMFTLLLLAPASAQNINRESVENRQSDIAEISTSLDAGDIELVEARDALRLLRTNARNAEENFSKQLDQINSQIETLGPVPEGDVVDTPDVAGRRKALSDQQAELNALSAQARLNINDAARLLDGLTTRQRETFVEEIFHVENSVFHPRQWIAIKNDAQSLVSKLPKHAAKWMGERKEANKWRGDLARAAGIGSLIVFLFWPLRIWLRNKLRSELTLTNPKYASRYLGLLLRVASRMIPAAIVALIVYTILIDTNFVPQAYRGYLKTIIFAGLTVLLAESSAVALFNPLAPKWRIISLNDEAAKQARRLSVWAVATYALGHILSKMTIFDGSALGVDNAAMIFTSIGVVILLFIATRKTHWFLLEGREEDISSTAVHGWSKLRHLGMPFSILISLSLVFGYQHLAYFLSQRGVLFIGIIIWIWVLRRGLTLLLAEYETAALAKDPDTPSASRQAMVYWVGLVMDGVILLTIIPIALLFIGTDTYSVRAGLIDAFTGIQIGNFTLSLADLLMAAVTFITILFVTRFLQRNLDTRLFSKSHADVGFRNSFRTLLGYVGLIVAIFAAVGVLGLDFSKLAIIAGALSVGIGFGLQSIVNNFVSGLILLFERPIKVGDWVVASSGEGIVKSISVRSTEIETFDRASVIVPNSELISSSVKNLTHKNKIGRVVVPVGIAYGSDAKKVRELLLKIAADNSVILSYPEPFVYFKKFGASSLDMELRVFIRDVSKSPIIRNDLRFEILDVFRKEKIEIPFPQHDLHLRSGFEAIS